MILFSIFRVFASSILLFSCFLEVSVVVGAFQLVMD